MTSHEFSIWGTLIFLPIVIEISKIDIEVNKQDIEVKLPRLVITAKKQ